MKRNTALRRYGIWLFLGYVALFARLHYPVPFGGQGLLALAPRGYLQRIQALDPFPLGYAGAPDLTRLHIQFVLLAMFAVLVGLYFRLLYLLRRNPDSSIGLRHILGGMLLFSIPLLLSPYLLSTDIHIYIFYGRMSALYHANPALVPPSAFPNDPFFSDVYPLYHNTPSVYGPVWMLVAHVSTLIAQALGGAQWVYVLVFKLSALGFHVASVVVLWFILGNRAPEQRAWGTLLFAWNPLALIEFAGSAHNDSLMLCFVLFGVWMAQRGRWRVAMLAFVGATLVKWIALLLIPLYALIVVRQQHTWRARSLIIAQMAAIGTATAFVAYLPFGSLHAAIMAITTMPAANMFANSLSAFIVNDAIKVLDVFGTTAQAREAIRAPVTHVVLWISRVISLLGFGWAMLATWKRPTLERFAFHCCVLMLIILGATSWFWPWYIIWPLAFVPLLNWEPLGRTVAWLSAAVLLVYVQVYSVIGPLILISIGAFFLVSAIRRWRRSTNALRTNVPQETPSLRRTYTNARPYQQSSRAQDPALHRAHTDTRAYQQTHLD